MEELKFAVLIDGDNSSSQYIGTIMEEMAKEGVITYKRIYGDFTQTNLNPWKKILLENSITPMQQYAYTTGKNATDSAMIIDAMDILYTGKVNGFCLVSSDSDFTKLAARLREAGMIVIGMGKKSTPKPFIAACSKFKYLDLISGEDGEDKKPAKKPAGEKTGKTKKTPPSAKAPDTAPSSATAEGEKPTDRDEQSSLPSLKQVKQIIDKIIDEHSDPEGWVLASVIGDFLQKTLVDFDSRNYNYKRTIDLLKGLGYKAELSADKSTYKISK